ncbi:MAG: zinc ribbon domain-containing protein [Peptococcaceae bacterium]|nr:zinc ribbon domain-containing protein [Peptococcaceae bacterium]
MPIYEFKCGVCNERVSLLCKMSSDGAEMCCPGCGTVGLSRVLSSFASPGTGGQDGCGSCPSSNCASCTPKH